MNKKPSKTSDLRGRSIADIVRFSRSRSNHWLRLRNLDLAEIPEEVFTFRDVEIIDLSGNNLRTLPKQLWELPKLRQVRLLGNPIETLSRRSRVTIDLPIYRRCRGQLKPENISLVIGKEVSNQDVNWWLSELEAIKSPPKIIIGELELRIGASHEKPKAPMQKILDSLAQLHSVGILLLRGLQLNSVPEGIHQLSNLRSLNLDGLGLTNLPNWIGDLSLQSLSVIDNRLLELPDSLRNLKTLRYLSIGLNPLTRIPGFVFELTTLQRLSITGCPIRDIPPQILHLSQLKSLTFDAIAIESPPPEVATNGLDAIRNYWRQREDEGVDYLCEAKLIILGESGAGKTSLAKKIENPNYKLREREKSTEGIDVIRHRFPTVLRVKENSEEKFVERNFEVNIWDFGGQEIYHATHQFFLTRRSVYVLVCDDRKEDTDFSYWLQVVEMLSDGSPILIVQNEKQDRKRDINLSSLRAQFANLRGALSTNLETNRGLDDVVKFIRKELENLSHVGVGLPATWKRVREALEKDQRDHISLEEYLRVCQHHGFTRRDDKLQLSGYLHDLGICLHFQDDPLLKNTIVLNPSWGTDAVYRVLDDSEVTAAHGLFTRKELARIWSEKKYAGMQDELLRLMMKFQLCYELETDQSFIAPQLLSSDQPPYLWEPTGNLTVRYEYGFLPKGIITRFIVAMHRLIANGRLVWKTGVVLERDGSVAEVIEEYSQRRIQVRVSGPAQRELLAIVDDQLERLHASFPRLQYERYLPCPCNECQEKTQPYMFALDKLIKMAKKEQAIQCHESGEMVNAFKLVREVLPGAFAPYEIAHLRPTLPLKSPQPLRLKTSVQPIFEVFVSYGWTPESGAIVDRIQDALGSHDIQLLRDREEVRYKDSIRDFMHRVGRGKCVVVVISEKYLKSENCMFEMIEIAKSPGLRERIFPIVLSDANIYKATGRIKYVRYWEAEIQELDEALKTVRGDNLTKLQEDLNLYSEIRRVFDGITDTLRDMNALTPDQHEGSGFEELIRRIRAQLSA